MPSPRRISPGVLFVLVAGFLLLRAALFAFTTAGEYALYQRYADAVRETSLAEFYRTQDVEYPPLGVLFGVVASHVADVLPDSVEVLTTWRPNPSREVTGAKYEVALGIVLFAVDLACLVLVYWLARQIYPDDSPLYRLIRLGVYVAASTAIGLILYDRQDLPVGLVGLLAVAAFTRGWSIAAYVLLAAGTAYKLVPVLLFPLFVFAFATTRSAPATNRSYLIAVVKEAVIAGLILIAYPVLSWFLCAGGRSFVFLTFHSDRGLQLESAWTWLVFLFEPQTETGFAYCSHTLRGTLADQVAKISSIATILGELLVIVVAGRGFWRAATAPQPPARNALVTHLVAGSLLAWIGFILFTKVGSPQYLLWLAPLLPLMPLKGWDRWWAVGVLVSMVFTSLSFPCQHHHVRGEETGEPLTWTGPTAFGMVILAGKSLSLLVSFVWLAVIVWRNVPAPLPSPETA